MARISSDKLEIMSTEDIIFTLKTNNFSRIPSHIYDIINSETDFLSKMNLETRTTGILFHMLVNRILKTDKVIFENFTDDKDNYLLHLLVGGEILNNGKYPNYADSWDNIMLVVGAINLRIKHGIAARDAIYTINYLLGGGYRFGSDIELKPLAFTLENLYARCVMYAKHEALQQKLFTIESSFVDLV